MTYKQLADALNQLKEWDRELSEIKGHNYDPHGFDSRRIKEIERLMLEEIPW